MARQRGLGPIVVALALGMALATSAGAAASLSGTYEGKLSCKGLASGAAAKSKQDIVVAVLEDPIGFNMEIHAGATQIGADLRGFVMDDAGKPDRAKLFGIDCPMEVISLSSLTLIADAVAKEGSEKATLKGSLTDTSGKTQILDCTFSVKRTGVAPPKIDGCPIN